MTRYDSCTVESHTSFEEHPRKAEVEILLHHDEGTREKARISRTHPVPHPYEVRIDIFDAAGLSKVIPVAHTTSVRGYDNAATTARNLIADAAHVIPDAVQRTALRLIKLGGWFESREIGTDIPRLTGYNPMRSNQEFFIAEVTTRPDRTKYWVRAETPPVRPVEEIQEELQTRAVRAEYSNLNTQYQAQYNDPRHDDWDDDKRDPTELVEFEELTQCESIDEVKRIRNGTPSGDTSSDDEWGTDPESAEQAALSSF